MIRVGVTGHRSLGNAGAWSWVAAEMSRELDALNRPVVGLSSLAPGSDQLFAQVVLKMGGLLEVIVPFPGYRSSLPDGPARGNYDRLIGRARRVQVLEGATSDEHAYLRAGKAIVRDSELLLAVWDGQPARGVGGTGDVVQEALSLGRPVLVLDPLQRSVTRHG